MIKKKITTATAMAMLEKSDMTYDLSVRDAKELPLKVVLEIPGRWRGFHYIAKEEDTILRGRQVARGTELLAKSCLIELEIAF